MSAINQLIDIRVGSRKSKLALIQTESVIKQLKHHYGCDKYNFIVKSMTTKGDHILDVPLSQIGDKALFTKELENQLTDNEIDFVVHSLKDLPTVLPNGLSIAAITEREDSSDALVVKKGVHLEDPMDMLRVSDNGSETSTLGTSSLRRIAQLKSFNPNLKILDIRGNVNTRLEKLDDVNSSYSALILASAGLKRANLQSRISRRLTENWYYAVGQGALAIETRTNDSFIIDLLKPLIDRKTTFECLAERTFLQQLEGGCSVPIGVRCVWNEDKLDLSQDSTLLTLDGIVLSLDGVEKVQNKMTIDLKQTNSDNSDKHSSLNYTAILVNDKTLANMYKNCAILGHELAQKLYKSGAKQILESIKRK